MPQLNRTLALNVIPPIARATRGSCRTLGFREEVCYVRLPPGHGMDNCAVEVHCGAYIAQVVTREQVLCSAGDIRCFRVDPNGTVDGEELWNDLPRIGTDLYYELFPPLPRRRSA